MVILGNQIVALGNQSTRLEKIVTTQAIKTDEVLKLMASKPASPPVQLGPPVQVDYSAVYWIVGGLVLLALFLVGFLLFVGVVVAIFRKSREARNG